MPKTQRKPLPAMQLAGLKDPTLRLAARTPTHARRIMELIRAELAADPGLVRNVEGLFIVEVLRKGRFVERWFLLFQGRFDKPYVGETRPVIPAYFKRAAPTGDVDAAGGGGGGGGGKRDSQHSTTRVRRSYPLAAIEVEDDYLVKLVTGGVTGFNAFSNGKLRIAGDLLLAQQLEAIFVRAHGADKVLAYLREDDAPTAATAASMAPTTVPGEPRRADDDPTLARRATDADAAAATVFAGAGRSKL